MALKHKGVVVGIKSAHYNGPDWKPYEQAVIGRHQANIPVMIDFGGNVQAGRTLMDLLMKYLRPGDIFTHMYGGSARRVQNAGTKGRAQAMIDGRKRGIIFDVGHGGTSFRCSAAIPMVKAGFLPDSISTDLHTSSMNSAMKDMLNVMGKFLAMGVPLEDVILRSTWNPAKEISWSSWATCRWGRRRICRAPAGEGQVWIRRSPRRATGGRAEAFVRDHGPRRQGRLRPERVDSGTLGYGVVRRTRRW